MLPKRFQEERNVLAVSADGLQVTLDAPLEREHLGIWYHHPDIPTPTDLRAAVGLLSKNVRIQGV